jgi:hypothetical protein
MNDFLSEIQCDELNREPSQSDWLEFQLWLDSLPIREDEIGVEVDAIGFPIDGEDIPF